MEVEKRVVMVAVRASCGESNSGGIMTILFLAEQIVNINQANNVVVLMYCCGSKKQ